MEEKSNKYFALNGLRGLAACHIMVITFQF